MSEKNRGNPTVAAFLDEVCIKDEGVQTPCNVVFDRYKLWYADNGRRYMALASFYNEIVRVWPHVKRRKVLLGDRRRWCFVGLGIKDPV
ncbi:primase-like DNA-binding domain-containing protein [Thermodesulfobacteriota bacterium]